MIKEKNMSDSALLSISTEPKKVGKYQFRTIEKACGYCGEVFIAFSPNAQYCPEHKDRSTRVGEAKRRRDPNKKVHEFCKKVDAYNEEHKTLLSYGQLELVYFLKKQKRERKGKR